jgi:hypothetical protein
VCILGTAATQNPASRGSSRASLRISGAPCREVAAFLQSKSVTPKVDSADLASQRDLDEFAQATGVQLPSSFSDFFTTFSNGYSFAWELGDESGEFSMPNLESLLRCDANGLRLGLTSTADLTAPTGGSV